MSNDFGLGTPFNVASAALLLSIVARLTGYTPRKLVITSNDAHIYENHLDMVNEILNRVPNQLPTLSISDEVPTFEQLNKQYHGMVLTQAVMDIIDHLDPDHFQLENYHPQAAISAPMAV